MHPGSIPVVDLFAGPGGLGEGFSTPPTSSKALTFRVALSVEKDPIAHLTLALRSFFRQFGDHDVPEDYYSAVRGEIGLDELYRRWPQAARAAHTEAWRATLGEVRREDLNGRIRSAIGDRHDWLLVGGPPCQAYSLAGRSRNQGIPGYDASKDRRHFLYVEYLQVIADHWPAFFVMENVKGLLSARVDEQQMFSRILSDLQDPCTALKREGRSVLARRKYHYAIVPIAPTQLLQHGSPSEFIVAAERFGIPQARHRLILLGVRSDLRSDLLDGLRLQPTVTVGDAIDGLPRIRAGVSSGDAPDRWKSVVETSVNTPWFRELQREHPDVAMALESQVGRLRLPRLDRGAPYLAGEFRSRALENWYCDSRLKGILQHESRSHRSDDLHRYLFASVFAKVMRRSPTLRDFPNSLLPRHQNVALALEAGNFADRFRVQVSDRPARTVTSHIAKDGHYYIHPDPSQCRSLTLREAARLQTFPDNYYFCGPRTAGLAQVGNAVPPFLAFQIADRIRSQLGGATAISA